MAISDKLLEGLRDGCFCLNVSTEEFLEFISSSLLVLKKARREPCNLEVLETLSVLENLVTFSVLKRRQFYCKKLYDFLLAMVTFKPALLTALTNLLEASEDQHVVRQSHHTLTHILCLLPCKMTVDEETGDLDSVCDDLCLKTIKSSLAARDDLGIHLAHTICTLNEHEKHLVNCQTSKVTVKGDGLVHLRSVRLEVLAELKRNWRSSWINQYLLPNIRADGVSDPLLNLMNLWRVLVDVRNPNITYGQARDFNSSTKALVDLIPEQLDRRAKLKLLEILNEVLCYGSTLGIQSEIPFEASEVAQKILQKALRTDDHFDGFHVPCSQSGMASGREQTSEPSLQAVKGLVLLYLKSVAVVVKESQAGSSSSDENSDCSISSRGSGSLAEEEREVSLIAGNVLQILKQLSSWSNRLLKRHHTSSLTSTVIDLFSDQDDALIEALLCLLDINIHCHNQTNYFNQYHETTSPNVTAATAIVELLDPLEGFEGLAQSVSNDHSVLLDFLVSNETCFLLYFLRFLKFINKRTSSVNSVTQDILTKMKTSIAKLTDKSLFPYDISPVLKLLEKVV